VFTNLGKVGSDVSRILIALAPFSRAGTPALQSLGKTADVGGPALVAAKPTIEKLGAFTSQARHLTNNLAALLTSVDQTNGIKYLTQLILNLGLSVNGYDQLGHYLRTALLAGCNSEATVVNPACSARFVGGGGTAASASQASKPKTPLAKLLSGEDPAKVWQDYRRTHHGKNPPAAKTPSLSGTGAQPAAAKPKPQSSRPSGSGGSAGGNDALLNYLLGSGG